MQCGRIDYGFMFRAKDPNLCAIQALAMYFFERWHVQSEPPPNFEENCMWYGLQTLPSLTRIRQDEVDDHLIHSE